MSPETQQIPDWSYIEASLAKFTIGDEFGGRVTSLIHKLKQKDSNSVWAKRLALYEVARREAWVSSFTSLSDLGIDGLLLERLTYFAIQRLTQPGRVVAWEDLPREVAGKRIILEHGSYSSIPTIAHVGYVNHGTVGPLGGEVNILSLDSAAAIRGLKGERKIVLADDLRAALWRHVPGVDVVTVTPDFDTSAPRDFWVGQVYPMLAGASKQLTILCSYGDQVAEEKMLYARFVKNVDVRVVYRDHWHREFGNPLYPEWTTTQWDQVSEDHQEFERVAREYLVG